MEVDENVGAVAVDLLEGEPRIPGPEVKGLTQLQPDPARVQAAGLLGSQTAEKNRGNIPVREKACVRSMDRRSIRRRAEDKRGDINGKYLRSARQDDPAAPAPINAK